ncbi:hypothetical protein CBR_g4805 [Chara braunii]|uniref:Uncharacterized protein n=1 Tax=Chara braunii TaxID=69332 RepID=A0A388KIX0_CHABU|nr:hypothetical protein CBR_g4805 [Chara braunii]|eukprot:GBG69977.1 hypothetical protein CBR_g4805 [Chara braunii]
MQNQLRNLEIGLMCATSPGSARLTIGYHQLEGKRVALKKPLVILKKKVSTLRSSSSTKAESEIHLSEEVGSQGEAQDKPERSSVEYLAIGVIKHKYLFKTRPRAIISKPDGKNRPW